MLLPTKVLLALLPFFLRAKAQSTGTTTRYWGKPSECNFLDSLSWSSLLWLWRCFMTLTTSLWHIMVLTLWTQTVANLPVLGLAKQLSFPGLHLCWPVMSITTLWRTYTALGQLWLSSRVSDRVKGLRGATLTCNDEIRRASIPSDQLGEVSQSSNSRKSSIRISVIRNPRNERLWITQ